MYYKSYFNICVKIIYTVYALPIQKFGISYIF